MASLRTNDSDLSSDEIRDFRRLYKLYGGGGGGLGKESNESSPRLKKLYGFFRDLEDYQRDYLTPTEFGICVGTLLFYGGILAGFYKMYMFLSAEEDRILREIRRRRKSVNNSNNGNNGNNGNNSNNSNNGNNGNG